MTVDLTGPRAVIESTFTDECTITRDTGGTHDDVLDPATFRLTRPVGDTSTIYVGPCSVAPEQNLANDATEGGQVRAVSRYLLLLPATATPQAGDLVHVTSLADPDLVDRPLRIASVENRSHLVVRKAHIELRAPVADRP